MLDRAVVDRLPGVVAHRSGSARPGAQAEVGLLGAEHHPVDVVHRDPVEPAGRRPPRRGRHQLRHGTEADVAERDERLDRLQRDPQPERVAEGAVGVGEGAVELRVLLGGGRHHLAGTGQDVQLQHRLVRHPVAEGRRLDPQAADGAAQGDGPQLRHHEGGQPVGQGDGDEVLVGAHPLDVRRPRHGVDGDHATQARGVQARRAVRLPAAEQVGGRLGQPDGRGRRDRPVARQQTLHPGLVPGGADGAARRGDDADGSDHPLTLDRAAGPRTRALGPGRWRRARRPRRGRRSARPAP